MKKAWLFALVFAGGASLFGAGLWAQEFQRSVRISPDGQITAIPNPPAQSTSTGTVISGENFGFRLSAVQPRNRAATGTVVVRIGGEWFEVSSPMTLQPAADR